MTIIYSLNSLINGTRNTLYEMKHKFYLYQKINYILIYTLVLFFFVLFFSFHYIGYTNKLLIRYKFLLIKRNPECSRTCGKTL